MSVISPATAAGAAVLVVAWAVWWAIATGRLDRGRGAEPADDRVGSTRVGERPALAGYVLSGTDGNLCRVLPTAGPVTVARLVGIGAVHVAATGATPDDVELGVAMGTDDLPDEISRIEREVLGHLRRCAVPAGHDALPTVSTGTLWHNPPSTRWWRTVRRSLAAEAVTAGLARPTVAPAVLAPSILAGVVVAAIGGLDLLGAMVSFDVGEISPTWTLLGAVGARLALDATRTALEPPHRLTRAGRLAATLLSHRHGDLAREHGPDSGLTTGLGAQDPNGLAMAAALGVTTRLARQVPVPGSDSGLAPRARILWSAVGDGVRPVQVFTPTIPGRGGRPALAVATGLGLLAAGVVLRRGIDAAAGASVITDIRESAPAAVDGLDTVLGIAAAGALVPLLLGLFLAVAGGVDSAVTRTTVGQVIDVRLPDRDRAAARASLALAGVGGDGVPLVELTVDTGVGDRIGSWLVDERAAAPVGATVEVRHSPVLGRVWSIRPVGSAGQSPG
jgi:hypothetical protein